MPRAATNQRSSFDVSTIASIAKASTGRGLTNSEKRASARAIIRHQIHTTSSSKSESGGLHPMYGELHGNGNTTGVELEDVKLILSESFGDLLDTVSYLFMTRSSDYC